MHKIIKKEVKNMNLVKEIVMYDDATIEKVKREAELAANEAQSH